MAEEFTHPTLDKISNLRGMFKDNPAYTDDVERIGAWEAQVKDLIAREELAENTKIQETVRDYRGQIASICSSLITQDSTVLPDTQRDRLLDKKVLYESFIDRFDLKVIREELATVDKDVQAELDSIQ